MQQTVEMAGFETQRLILRQWRQEDKPLFADINSDPRVMAYMPKLLNRSESDAMVDRFKELINQRGWGFWAVEFKQNQKFIGYVGLHIPSADLPFKPCIEIGWRLAFDYWGQGLAYEAASASLKVGFEMLELTEIVTFTTLINRRSIALMERLNMVRDSLVFAHPRVPAGHPLSQHCLYRLSKQRWAKHAGKLPVKLLA